MRAGSYCACLLLCLAILGAAHAAAPISAYTHIFVIIEENRTADQIIDNPAAPALNRLAKEYGLATNYFGVRHPSEPNYVALVGGDTFGITDDDAFYCRRGVARAGCEHSRDTGYVDHTIAAPTLTDRLASRGLSWKGYFESIPKPGSLAYKWPTNGRKAGLYAVKHNGFMFFKSVQKDKHRARKIVGFDALDRDIADNALPNFAHIVPNQCNDMHGLDACRDEAELVRRADRTVDAIVTKITATPMWKGRENCAIVITFDEDGGDSATHDNSLAALPSAGGWVVTIVIANHGPRRFVDAAPYDHYSLLRSIEEAFGLPGHLGRAAGATSMTPLFTPLANGRSGP
jgi:phosphatidylinositol-3-phosphatase